MSMACITFLVGCGGSGESATNSSTSVNPSAQQVQVSDVGVNPATASTTEWGYVPLPDGNELRYTAWLPEGDGPFPVLMMYEGYFAGSDPSRAAPVFVLDMLAKGYATVGVSLRGSGCSSGSWELFNLQQAQDGAFAVDWLAQRPWSNGKVAMYGYSYAGIMQLWVASMKPKHLVAIGPGMPVVDTYRDIGFPGGILNNIFPPVWGAGLNTDWATAYQDAVEIGDTKCLQNGALHTLQNNLNSLALQIPQHPTDDSWHHAHSIKNWISNIDVPLFAVQAWQDDQTGGRAGYYYNQLNPDKTWLIASNGHHTMHQYSNTIVAQYQSFYDHFLKGVDNGFDKTPRVQIWHETSISELAPRSVTTLAKLPVKVEPTAFYLSSEGLLVNDKAATADSPGTSYIYPLPAPNVVESAGVLDRTQTGGVTANTWTISLDNPLGRAVFTTPALERTVTTFGSSSVDLWVSTTANDVDLQVTIVEVRPDGQEQYIQRGWLRASHRALDEQRSTELQPHHPHTSESLKDMTPGVPELLRVDMMPFSHAFRKDSSIRIYVENPSVVGLWGFQSILTPQSVTIHHDAEHPSKIVLGELPNAQVKPELTECGTVDSQPCRSNPVPQP
jgi:uncharacterized protein